MVGTDESTELWRPPSRLLKCYIKNEMKPFLSRHGSIQEDVLKMLVQFNQ